MTACSEAGNGKGKPRGKSWSSLIEEISTSEVDATGDSLKRQIVKRLLYEAKNGSSWAIQEVLNRMEGKAVQQTALDVTSGGESLGAQITFVSTSNELVAGNDDTIMDADLIEKTTESVELPETIDT